MKIYIFAFLLIFNASFLFGLEVSKGWSLISSSYEMSLDDFKKYHKLEKAYLYKDGKWAENADIKPNDGVLVYSKNNFYIYYGQRALADREMQSQEEQDRTISLNKGWNLKALSMSSSISTRLFDKDVIVYTYDTKSKSWNSYNPDKKKNNSLVIDSMQGFYIYSPTHKEYDLDSNSLNSFESQKDMNTFLLDIVKHYKIFRTNEPQRPIAYAGSSTENSVGIMEDAIQSAPEIMPALAQSSKKLVQDATNTNTQETDIDEADILKHNGEDIFFTKQGKLYQNSFSAILNDKAKSTQIEVFKNYDDAYISSIYLSNNKLVVIGNAYNFSVMPIQDLGIEPRMVMPRHTNSEVHIEIYDVVDSAVHLANSISIEGSISDSRIYNDKLFIVSKFNPYLQVSYKKKYDICDNYRYADKKGKCYMIDYDNYTIDEEHIAPNISIDGKGKNLLDYKKFFAKFSFDYLSSITTLTSLDLNNINAFDSLSTIINSSMIYMSSEALYLSATSYNYFVSATKTSNNSTTSIYKISTKDNLNYIDYIDINGRAINQFAFSEYNQALRVATTSGFGDDTNNMIYVVNEENSKLKQVGFLGELGKKGERIKSVRFMQDKGYVVTFKQTDPFYTIDLSDIYNPKKVGELSISGFSTYLQDIGDNKILALGNDADENGRVNAMQIQLFDVSNFSKPTLVNKYLFDYKEYSNSLYNHKAFTYRQSDKKFALQVNNYKSNFNGFYVFEINNNKIKELDKINNNEYFYDGRSIIFTKDSNDYILMLNNDLTFKQIQQ